MKLKSEITFDKLHIFKLKNYDADMMNMKPTQS